MSKYAHYSRRLPTPKYYSTPLWALLGVLLCAAPLSAQEALFPGEDCTVHVLNQTIHVAQDGSWRLPNVPTNGGLVRARLHCNSAFGLRQGQSPFFVVEPNSNNIIKSIAIAEVAPGPTRLNLSVDKSTLSTVGEQMQVQVTGEYGDSDTKELSSSSQGTNYRSTNNDVLSVNSEGLLTAHKSGAVVIAVWNESITAALQIQVVVGNDSDNDGLPDDYENEMGLNPDDPVDALIDQDADNLTALQEFQNGTNPFDEDTDGDSLPDGEEVTEGDDGYITSPILKDTDNDLISDNVELMVGTDPTDATSFDLNLSLLSLDVTPQAVTLYFNTLVGEASTQFAVMGVQLDGTGIDLTEHPQTNYKAQHLTIANFGLKPGQLFAGQNGTTTAEITVGIWEEQIPVLVESFEPQAVSNVKLGCKLDHVHFFQNNVYAACGVQGLRAVSLSDLNEPKLVLSASDFDAFDLADDGELVWVATGGDTLLGLDMSNPAEPKEVKTVNLPNIRSLAFSGQYLIAGSNTDGPLTIIDPSPAAAAILGTVTVPGMKDLAASGNLAALVLNNGSLAVVDFSTPENPVLASTSCSGCKLRKIDMNGSLAVTATSSGISMKMTFFELTEADEPKLLSSIGHPNFLPIDVVLEGDLAFASDVYRVNDVPIVNAQDPENPIFSGVIAFPGDTTGMAVDATLELVAMGGSNGQLYIGQHRKITDNGTIAPLCTFINPAQSTQIVAGAQFPIHVSAIDDVIVSFVDFYIDGESINIDSSAPFLQLLSLPATPGETIQLDAKASDSAGNIGECAPIILILAEDPLLSVTGKVVDADQNPVEGATVTISNTALETTTDATGSFIFTEVPSVKSFNVFASAQIGISFVGGASGTVTPDPFITETAQVLDVGNVVLEGSPPPQTMGPVASRAITFEAFPAAYDTPIANLTMGPVASRAISFEAFPSAYTGGSIVGMGPVASKAISFEAFPSAYTSGSIVGMGPVASKAITFEAFPSAYTGGAIVDMGPVASKAITFEAFPNAYANGSIVGMGPIASRAISFVAEEAADVCAELAPCQNNGQCTNDNSSNGYTCTCAAGFGGEQCQSVLCNFDGLCDLEIENCASCSADCGSCCCLDGGAPQDPIPGAEASWENGCGNAAAEDCVCNQFGLTTCCTENWSEAQGCTLVVGNCGVTCGLEGF